MMSRQDGTFLPRVLRFDWSVVNQLLLASSPIQLVKIESLGCPSTVNSRLAKSESIPLSVLSVSTFQFGIDTKLRSPNRRADQSSIAQPV